MPPPHSINTFISPTLSSSTNPPSSKKPRTSHPPISSELGKYIQHDVNLLAKLGWTTFIQNKRQRGDIAALHFKHTAQPLLQHIKKRGIPVVLSTPPWSHTQLNQAIKRGPHRSCHHYIDFLEEEFLDMMQKNQWIILPYAIAKSIPNLCLSPPGVVPQRNRRPRWIGDYSWSGINDATLPLAPLDSMQFGNALDRYLREILLSDPQHGPIFMLKLDIADGFYRLNIAPTDIPKLGVVFPSRPGQPPLVALPLVLPMGWKNSPPYFCAATETAADIANQALQSQSFPAFHPLESHAAALDSTGPTFSDSTESTVLPAPPEHELYAPVPSKITSPALQSQLHPAVHPLTSQATASDSTGHTYSANTDTSVLPAHRDHSCCTPVTPLSPNIPPPSSRDPCLPCQPDPLAYVDVFVDDFIALCQGNKVTRSNVRSTLLHAVDSIFRPNDFYDSIHRREPISLKKLRQGDASWNTVKQVLGWVINTSSMTIHLPPHRVDRLNSILSSIPLHQKRLSIKKWHKTLGELRSMSLALPGSRNLFSTMQHALTTKTKTRIALRKGVHAALQDFRWMQADISNRPTRIAEIIPLNPCAKGYHDASGQGAGGVWFCNPELCPRQGTQPTQPLVWRLQWPHDILSNLVTTSNPHGSVTNSDLELAGGLLHLDVIAQSFDIRERTILSNTDNLATLFWQRKGNATTLKPPSHLLRLFGIHQRYHRYVPRHDYIPGLSNPMADDASRLFHLTNTSFLSHFNHTFPQPQSYKLVNPSSALISSVISALRMKTCNLESLLVAPLPPTPTGPNGSSTPLSWASTPFSKPSKIKYPSSKSSSDAFAPEHLLPSNVRSSLGQLRTTYGRLHRRTLQWGPQTHV